MNAWDEVLQLIGEIQCGCTVRERASGHRSDCTLQDVRARITERLRPTPGAEHAQSHPTAAQSGAFVVRAKPIEWIESRPGCNWHDTAYCYSITLDEDEAPDARYAATIGEDDPLHFATLDAAKSWCQRNIDRWVADHAVVTIPGDPAAAPSSEDREHAARYLILREDFSPMGLNIDGNHVWIYRGHGTLRGPNLDAAIDAKRATRS